MDEKGRKLALKNVKNKGDFQYAVVCFCLYRLHNFFSPQISSSYEGNVKEQMLFMYGEKPNIRLTLKMAALFILSR